MSTSSIWSAARTTESGTVSFDGLPVIAATTSLIDSRLEMLTVVITSIPSASNCSTISQRPLLLVDAVGEVVDEHDLWPSLT